MTDQILSGDYVDSLVMYHENSLPWRRAWTGKLIVSHRLLQQRVTELEALLRKELIGALDDLKQAVCDD